ncbi:MAG TPA: hypothetical protein VF753_11265 [Terriglobales bacterium]
MNSVVKFCSVASAVIVAFSVFGQPAVAQQDAHFHRQAMPLSRGNTNAIQPLNARIPDLNGLQATFTQDYPIIGANADGSDLWPCFGNSPANPDCPTVGNPSIALPLGGIVTGFPSYVWRLENTPSFGNGIGCDALVNGTGASGVPYMPCGQIATWYEDNTADSTDDLLWRITVTQGRRIIYDAGTVDFGPAGPTVKYPVDVVLASDANFGFWPGAQNGPNNGNCSPDSNYPLTSPTFPTGKIYVVQHGKTCEEPAPGPATVTTSTVLATPEYTQVTGNACTSKGVQSPCYTVKWIRRYGIQQNFNIVLE